jgi:hypothetical protein
MADETKKGPAWGYRGGKNGEIESKIFEDGVLPKGWLDTPASLKPKKEAQPTE